MAKRKPRVKPPAEEEDERSEQLTEQPDEEPTTDEAAASSASDAEAKAEPVKVRVTKSAKTPTSAPGRPRMVLFIAGGVLVVGGVVTAVVLGTRPAQRPAATVVNTNTAIPAEELVPRLLDGTPVKPSAAARWPLAVMIDNDSKARPQSAIGLARVVYETLAEGGATRFMALFDGTEEASKIGPVRSARHYFVQLAEEYKAAYVHAGGSPQAAALLRTSPVTEFNLIGSGARYGYRDKSQPAPHNLYTDDRLMTFARRDKKLLDKPAEYASWLFEPEPPLSQRPTTPLTVSIKFSGKTFQADWRYNRDRNVFERSTGELPHLDALTNAQVTAKTVVVISVPAEKSLGEKGRIDFSVTGEGKAKVFKDGTGVEGTWKRLTTADRIRFFDAAGAEIPFHPGPIWIEVLPGNREVVVTNS